MKKFLKSVQRFYKKLNFRTVATFLVLGILMLLLLITLISRISLPEEDFFSRVSVEELKGIAAENNYTFGLGKNEETGLIQIYTYTTNVNDINTIMNSVAEELGIDYDFLVENSVVIYPQGPRDEPTYVEEYDGVFIGE
jgi:hypothetical protein